ncbi:MAG: toprim domain-containing protein [Raineya sp.]|nr:toprim domain-containing protein [Raineya sp.]
MQSLKSLQNTTLLKYIEQRRLNPKFAKMYLKEIYYKIDANQPKNYFGICLENESKGFEVKNIYSEKYYCLGKKDISVIEQGKPKEWLIFEGMFDFIALLTHLNRLINGNVLILHSVTNTEKALKYLKNMKPETLYLFLDNDVAGNEATGKFMQAFICKDFRKLYNGFKDLNEMILSRCNT